MNQEINKIINKKYIELGKYEDAIHVVQNLWLPVCVVELLKEKVDGLRKEISKLEKTLK